MTDQEQHLFYENFVRRLRERGVVCGITSGLACVHFGVAETTKDCDLLCFEGAFGSLMEELATTQVEGIRCRYRGNLSPPLDARWHRGGWTSHFVWHAAEDDVTLDVFGRALRVSASWEQELSGLYSSPQVVAEMKRTNRDKDWPFITALGVKMIQSGDPRGWSHIFHHQTLIDLIEAHPCPPEVAARRSALQFALAQDQRAQGAIHAEMMLWRELDEMRIRIYERALRPYVSSVRKAGLARDCPLAEQHAIRLECALAHLPPQPLGDYGVARHIQEARQTLVDSGTIPKEALAWLPDVTDNFMYIES